MKLYKLINNFRYECYTIKFSDDNIDKEKIYKIFDTKLESLNSSKIIFEVRYISEVTPWTSNVFKILKKSNINNVISLTKSTIHLVDNCEIKSEIFNKFHDKMLETYDDFQNNKFNMLNNFSNDINEINDNLSLNLNNNILEFLHKNKNKIDNLLFIMLDLSQSDSEHCRHHFFNGTFYNDELDDNRTLFDYIKIPLNNHPCHNHSLIAFSDNSSAIKGYNVVNLGLNCEKKYYNNYKNLNFVLTAETHNFPTGVSPFQGAATGIGGRIRDVQATGTGAKPICSSAGYCVGKIKSDWEYPSNIASPIKILIDASDGASDYGNKFGEPIVIGFTRIFGNDEKNRVEWIKPIMFTSGLGSIYKEHLKKNKLEKGMLICKIGGPAYKVGLGGGSASSRISDKKNNDLDFSAVQRDDAEMEQKMNRVIQACLELGNKNPIESIHDQGAGGNGNVLKEIIEDMGAIIDIGKITLGDKSMNDIEIWLSEYQESNAIVIKDINKNILQNICDREDVQLDIVGKITGDGKLKIVNKDKIIIENYPLDFGTSKKKYYIKKPKISFDEFTNIFTFDECLNLVLSNETVGSKRFLTNKVDRSVTGLIAQQQCVGPLHTPLSNFALISSSFYKTNNKYSGCAKSIGEQPIVGLIDPKSMVHKTVSEMLTNIMFVKIDSLQKISCSANWMWPCPNKYPEEGYKMYESMKELSKLLCDIGIIVDGGKDSLSMAVKHNDKIIKCPGSLVLTAYASCPDIYKKITPDFKEIGSTLYFIDLSFGNMNMGGSILSYCINNLYCKAPYLYNPTDLKNTFNIVQDLIQKNILLSGHDKSDGGLITTLIEMSISSNIGFKININTQNPIEFLFNEEIGLVVESKHNIEEYFKEYNINIIKLGTTTDCDEVTIYNDNKVYYKNKLIDLRSIWEKPSYFIEKLQCGESLAKDEFDSLKSLNNPEYFISNLHMQFKCNVTSKYNIGIIRDEGSNSDKEMAGGFLLNHENVYDINTHDMMNNPYLLDNFNVIVFVGGFTYADTLGSAHGWYSSLKNNKNCCDQLERFYKRDNTYSLGVCNGCQLLVKLGWINKNIRMGKNISNRFESRFSQVVVNNNNSIFMKELQGLNFGIWTAHGEGRFIIDDKTIKELESNNQIVLNYTDFKGNITESYPFNPNGSRNGIAGICSKNGRHLAIMPHPERSYFKWQIPWVPKNCLKKYSDYTPWKKIFELN